MYFARDGHVVFEGIDMSIHRGKVVVIMGPSGVGKTTLLDLIGGQLVPDAGFVKVNQEPIGLLPRKELYAARRHMGMLFQTGALFTNISVFENVAFPLREHTHLPEEMIRTLVLMKLEAVGLRGARDLLPGQLSGGMARRVALARAIALDPDLMMYDEPFTGLDPISLSVVVRLIRQLNDALDMTSIIVSHHVDESAAIADYIYLIGRGRIIGEGSPQTMLEHEDPEVKQFMCGMPDGVVPFHYPADDYTKDLLL